MDKKFTPQEAAIAVLKKAEEMLKSSKVADYKRAQSSKEKGVHLPADHGAPVYHQEGKSSAGLSARAGTKAKARGVSDSPNAKAAVEGHKAKLAELKSMPKPNLTKDEAPVKEQVIAPEQGVQSSTGKGVHKLAKFMGHREEKRKSKAAPADQAAPMEKGTNDGKHQDNHAYNFDHMQAQKGVNKVLPKYDRETKKLSHGGSEANWPKSKEGKVAAHKQTLSDLKSMPKPNLPGGKK